MAKDCKDILLNREGTSQSQRSLEALQPEYLKLQDFDAQDWILFAHQLAKQVHFFETQNPDTPVTDWQGLFNHFDIERADERRGEFEYDQLKKTVKEALDNYEKDSTLTPHLTLFVCFIRLLEITQNRFNDLSKRHLDFYYKRVLNIQKQLPEPDKAHIIFELAKRIDDYKIAEQTSLNAGKDSNGNPLVFEAVNELIVNKAKISGLKSILNSFETKELKAAPVVNSLDGQGAELPEDAAFWHPFGYTKEQDELAPLPDAMIGFSIASPMLALKNGERNFYVRIQFEDGVSLEAFDFEEINSLISLEYTGAKKWIGPLRPSASTKFFNSTGEAVASISTQMTSDSLTLVFELAKEDPEFAAFNKEIHLDPYPTEYPVAKVKIDVSSERGYDLFRNLMNQPLREIEIKVSVEGVTDIIIENDTGVLKANKPFFPFSTQPKENSNFFVNYPEAFSKNWKAFNIEMLWKDAPESFIAHYWAYTQTPPPVDLFRAQEAAAKADGVEFISPNRIDGEADNQPNNNARSATPVPERIVNSENHFTADTFAVKAEEWIPMTQDEPLFVRTEEGTKANINLYKDSGATNAVGPIKISLDQSFLHELFGRLYALALTQTPIVEENVPLAAYTPLAEAISISYSANNDVNFRLQSEDSYNNATIELYHHTPYGLSQEHSYLKVQSEAAGIYQEDADKNCYLLPDLCQGGELYIGLEEAEAGQTISLLFQILEGSENPLADSFTGNQKIQWYVLCNNHWMDITNTIEHNQIDNMLQSGIVRIPLPKQATNDNSLLSAGSHWIKAKTHKTYDAVCKVIDIHAQAVKAQFKDNNNNLSHLSTGIEAETIGKLVTRVPQIKAVSQPYNSFDFKPLEEDAAFYQRVSERLRHKNRAITIWDYEHIVLQQFPEVYKVLCLKHTIDENYLAPGEVTLVVIPDIINKNVFDIYQPRVSTATLNKISEHVNALNSLHVTAKVINPEYQVVNVSLGVRFYKGFDKVYYTKQLNTDIIRFLSPWAFDSTKNIAFGTALHSSVLIDYLEELPYVDYLENVVFIDEDGEPQASVSPSKPATILVSAEEHTINDVTEFCSEEDIKPLESCKY